MSEYQRPILATLLRRLREPRRFIQVLAGPRQAGKTTLARQAMQELDVPSHYASADAPTLRDRVWLETEWEVARLSARDHPAGSLLVLDEVQKIPGWSEVVKWLWDADTARGISLQVALLGSAPLLVRRGLGESLASRFEVIRVPHWTHEEMSAAFDWDLDRYVFFGGYPGAAPLVEDEARWRAYILDSLVETTISRDVLLMTRVDKPALLRRVFELACEYSGQVLSYQKMLGQLQDAGNTTTLAHYLELLAGAGMVKGLQKFAGQRVRQRASSPRLQALNTALMSARAGRPFAEVRRDPAAWGRLVESAIGAHLVNTAEGTSTDVFFWRERNLEVDFVLRSGDHVVAIEVKTARRRDTLPGLEAFATAFPKSRKLVVGTGGLALEELFTATAEALTT